MKLLLHRRVVAHVFNLIGRTACRLNNYTTQLIFAAYSDQENWEHAGSHYRTLKGGNCIKAVRIGTGGTKGSVILRYNRTPAMQLRNAQRWGGSCIFVSGQRIIASASYRELWFKTARQSWYFDICHINRWLIDALIAVAVIRCMSRWQK